MSKRKAEVNDIVLEREELSSSEEETHNKVLHAPPSKTRKTTGDRSKVIEVVDSSEEEVIEPVLQQTTIQNSGKIGVANNNGTPTIQSNIVDLESDNHTLSDDERCDEDIVADSPLSDSINIVAGCDNKKPLVTVKFRDKEMAREYKNKIKEFMLKFIKIHDEENLTGSENETDLELDIWPEDLINNEKYYM